MITKMMLKELDENEAQECSTKYRASAEPADASSGHAADAINEPRVERSHRADARHEHKVRRAATKSADGNDDETDGHQADDGNERRLR